MWNIDLTFPVHISDVKINIARYPSFFFSSSSVLSDGIIQPLETWLWWKPWVCQSECIMNSLCITLGQYLSEPFEHCLKQLRSIHYSEVMLNARVQGKTKMSVEMDGSARPDLPALLLGLRWQGEQIWIDIGRDEICVRGQIWIRRHLCTGDRFSVR